MAYQLGIDLGTTFSAAAVSRSVGTGWAAPEMVALSDRRTDLPSVLFVGDDGEILVGQAAERRAVTDPDRVVREFKRRLGDPTPVVVGGRPHRPEELCARLVRWIVDAVAAQEGGPAERIALTHPASWGDHKMELLAEALEAHGLTVTFLAEPQAAALHYAAGERLAAGSTIAVYDLGGGTFDAAVVRKDQHGRFSLQGRPEGLDRLGGVDFDQVVFDHVVEGLPEAFAGLDDTDPAVLAAVARLRRECTEAKEALSSDTEVSVPVLLPAFRGTVRMHRAEFSDAIREQVGETVEALRRAVGSAGLAPSALDAVLLVGGSSRVPLVGQLVSEELGRPVTVDTDPTHAIAKGAALAVCPVSAAPDAPVTPVSPAVGMPVLVGTAAASGATATFAMSAPVNEAGPFDGWARGAPPRPQVGAPAPDWEYDEEPPAKRRAGLMVGAGAAAAVLAVVGAVLLWPTAEPAVTGGVGGLNVAPPAAVTSAEAVPPPTTEETAAPDPTAASTGGGTRSGGAAATPRTTRPTTRPVTPRPVVPAPQAPAPAPQNPAPQNPAPQNPVPQDPAPQNPAPQNPVPQDPAPNPDPGPATDPGTGGTGTGGASASPPVVDGSPSTAAVPPAG
ncbi:Hsp70 family protein [Pseudonocardia sp. WMMC193]|uniref:Hsp70 family protein n=1 Tax=Pseudonocardia sp. WMMC193 TaxID=2911965 RepID=UPI001F376715|nr:Hsp70 family protein [Pseudonocardia sp. WMMC193]MCF7552033.1 Hsp70 family protein [Pseudonocardia sp. WMMC193]